MKRISVIVTVLCLLMCLVGKAQKDTAVYYLDSTYNIVPHNAAVYIRTSVHRDKMYYAVMVNAGKGDTVYTGSYKDRDMLTEQGPFAYYTKNVVTMRGSFKNGKQVGVWLKWNKEGLVIDSVGFDDDGEVLVESKFNYHTNGAVWRYTTENADGQKISREFDTLGIKVSEGRFAGEFGETFFYYPDGKVKMHAIYKDNERTQYDFFDEDGKKYTEEEFTQLQGH